MINIIIRIQEEPIYFSQSLLLELYLPILGLQTIFIFHVNLTFANFKSYIFLDISFTILRLLHHDIYS